MGKILSKNGPKFAQKYPKTHLKTEIFKEEHFPIQFEEDMLLWLIDKNDCTSLAFGMWLKDYL